jgi:hypothetical protein
MELTIHVPDEFKLQAEAHGLAPETYAEKMLRDGLAITRPIPSLASIRTAVEELREFRKGKTLNGLSVKDLVNDGRKY